MSASVPSLLSDAPSRSFKKFLNNFDEEESTVSNSISEDFYNLSLFTNKSNEVGICVYDESCSDYQCYQFSDDSNYTQLSILIHAISPRRIIMPKTLEDSDIVKILKSYQIPQLIFDFCPRKFFDDFNGQAILDQCANHSSVSIKFESQHLSMMSLSAMVMYIEHQSNIKLDLPSILVDFQTMDSARLQVDYLSIVSLDVFSYTSARRRLPISISSSRALNAAPSTKVASAIRLPPQILGFLQTCTRSGFKYLRRILSQPITDIQSLQDRLDVLDFFKLSPSLSTELKSLFAGLGGLDKMLGLVSKVDSGNISQQHQKTITLLNYLKEAENSLDGLISILCCLPPSTPSLVTTAATLFCSAGRNILALLQGIEVNPFMWDESTMNSIQIISSNPAIPAFEVKSSRLIGGVYRCLLKQQGNETNSKYEIMCEMWDSLISQIADLVTSISPCLAFIPSKRSKKSVKTTTNSFAFHSRIFKLEAANGNDPHKLFKFTTKATNADLIPRDAIRVASRSRYLEFSIPQLDLLGARLSEVQRELQTIVDGFLTNALAQIRQSLPALSFLLQALGTLDCFIALSNPSCTASSFLNPRGKYSQASINISNDNEQVKFVRPILSDASSSSCRLALKQACHPQTAVSISSTSDWKAIRHEQKEKQERAFNPFDSLLTDANHVQIVTGANGAGKSTYLRTLALSILLAHVGAYVPAEFASVRILSKLFVRLEPFGSNYGQSSNASMSQGKSQLIPSLRTSSRMRDEFADFSLMDDLILGGSSTLVIVDEPCRSSDAISATAILWGALEGLVLSGANVIMATHLSRLVMISKIFPNVCNVHADYQSNLDGGMSEFRLKPGVAQLFDGYGISTAEHMGCSQAIVETAKKVHARLKVREMSRAEEWNRSVIQQVNDDRLMMEAAASLRGVGFTSLDGLDLLEWLKDKQLKLLIERQK